MNLKIFNHEFNVVDVRKIERVGNVFMFTVQLNTNIFTIDDWIKMHEKLANGECAVQNSLFDFDFKILLYGINYVKNISRDGVKSLISFDFCIRVYEFFDDDLFLSEIEKTKFRFNKI